MTEANSTKNRIMVAEDDPVSRRILGSFLGKWGYDVIQAVDGSEALAILQADDAPPLAVLDWMMPGLEGPEICREVRKNSERAYSYLLLLTARSQKEDVLKGLEAGADDYLTKPFDAQELRARLHVGQRILDLQRNLLAATDELRFRATHDILTGISNRASVLDALKRESARQVREGGSLGVILADIDHFKHVNDTYGHLVGDSVLIECAHRMKACARTYDVLGRYGGEEFLIVVPSDDARGTSALAERMRAAIADVPAATDAGPIPLTISLGIAVSQGTDPIETKELLRSADEALYSAKAGGRNRVECSQGHSVSSLLD
jgi:two-component system cell cycle response regulator